MFSSRSAQVAARAEKSKRSSRLDGVGHSLMLSAVFGPSAFFYTPVIESKAVDVQDTAELHRTPVRSQAV